MQSILRFLDGLTPALNVAGTLLIPPFGISIQVIKSVIDHNSVTHGQTFAGVEPFALMMLVLIFLSLTTALI